MLLVVVVVAMCIYMSLLCLVVVKFYLVRTWYQVKRFYADAHRIINRESDIPRLLHNYRVDCMHSL